MGHYLSYDYCAMITTVMNILTIHTCNYHINSTGLLLIELNLKLLVGANCLSKLPFCMLALLLLFLIIFIFILRNYQSLEVSHVNFNKLEINKFSPPTSTFCIKKLLTYLCIFLLFLSIVDCCRISQIYEANS